MDWIGAHLLSDKHVAREKEEAEKGEGVEGVEGQREEVQIDVVVDGAGVEPVKRVRKKRVQVKAESTGTIGEDESEEVKTG